MEYIPIRVSDIIRQVNRDIYLPAIQREFVWGPDRVERLFDSIMADFPIGSFLYWKLDHKNKDEWPVYEFVRDFDAESPHNQAANMAGIAKDITLVLDGQQRITSLFVGLRGSYRYLRYKWRKTRLYLNLLKPPIPNEDNPEELTYEFAFRENTDPSDGKPQLWYPAGRILDFEDAEDAKGDMKSQLAGLPDEQRENANKLIGRLHNRIHTTLVGNYYEEKSQEYEKVLQVFVRANSGGQPLEYSDLLLATATAKWETLDARTAIHDFTDSINAIGTGYNFGKDFVLKASLYLTDNLPVQYKVKNFTKPNLRKIEANWEKIKESLTTTVRLISRFGFNVKNVVAPLALLPIALFLLKRGNHAFDTSSSEADADAQLAIRRWFVFSTLQNAFGSSSDTILARLRDLLKDCEAGNPFPAADLYKSLGIKPHLNDAEIDRILGYGYQGRYTNLVLSLLYPDRDWKDAVFHEDHIFPQSEFQVRKLRKRGYDEQKIQIYTSRFNTLCNLQLLTESENLSKNATPFDEWLQSRDAAFRARHLIPELPSYDFDHFEDFAKARTDLIVAAMKRLGETPPVEHVAFSEPQAVCPGEVQNVLPPIISTNVAVEGRSEVRVKAHSFDENVAASGDDDVVVVPAHIAWPEYQQYHAYICQPDRPFRPVKRIAFYSDGHIYPLVPTIIESHDHVEFSGDHKGRLGELVELLLKANKRKKDTAHKVVFLSSPDSPYTLKLDQPIPNDCKSKGGKPTAFVQNQRYVSSERLKTAKTTSDLVRTSNAVKEQDHDHEPDPAGGSKGDEPRSDPQKPAVQQAELSTFARNATDIICNKGGCEILRTYPKAVHFIPASWAKVVPENGKAWKHLSRPVSVICWLNLHDNTLSLGFEVSRMDDPKLRLACVEGLRDAGFSPYSKAFRDDAKFSRFYRESRKLQDSDNEEEMWAGIEELFGKAKEEFPKAEAVFQRVFADRHTGTIADHDQQRTPMTFNEIINYEFGPEDIKEAIEVNGREGDVCDCYCDKCGEITPGTPFNKDDHCGSCTIYEHGDECECDACEYNRSDLMEEMRTASCYWRLEELSKTDKTPEVIQEMEEIQSYLSNQ